ncbi:MAG: transporter substrate-binding domain-containing protein, partial [Verrucomicrobiae bacterium]|nr:transporter substrate-binding domain-containing protein [Verrucomicrobiae bacterium]
MTSLPSFRKTKRLTCGEFDEPPIFTPLFENAKVATVLVTVALFSSFGGLNAEAPKSDDAVDLGLSPAERDWLVDHREIRYGADPGWPPFSLREGDDLSGLDREFIDLLGARLGVRFTYVPTENWDQTVEALRKEEIDLVTGVADLPERPLGINYSEPYTQFPLAIIMRTDGPFFSSIEQLERDGLRLGGPGGYAPTVFIQRNFPRLSMTETVTSLDALKLLSEGEVDAVVENLGVVAHLIKTNGLGNLKIVGTVKERFDPRFGVRADLAPLPGILNKALGTVAEQDRLQIYDHWVLVEISKMWNWREVAAAGVGILGVGLLAIGIVSFWNWRMKAELDRRRVVEASLRQSEERFRHLFEAMQDAYLLTQTDGKIQFVNESAVEMLKIGSKPVIERLSIGSFLERPDEFAELMNALRKGERMRDHCIELSSADGSTLLCRCNIQLVKG